MNLFCFAVVQLHARGTYSKSGPPPKCSVCFWFGFGCFYILGSHSSPWVTCLPETGEILCNLFKFQSFISLHRQVLTPHIQVYTVTWSQNTSWQVLYPISARSPLPDSISKAWVYFLSIFSVSHSDYGHTLNTFRAICCTTQLCSGRNALILHYLQCTSPLSCSWTWAFETDRFGFESGSAFQWTFV